MRKEEFISLVKQMNEELKNLKREIEELKKKKRGRPKKNKEKEESEKEKEKGVDWLDELFSD